MIATIFSIIVSLAIMVFLATLFMWPDTMYRMNGNLDRVRAMTGGLFTVLLFVTLFKFL